MIYNNEYDEFKPSNTIASANFDILNMDGINDPLINVNRISNLDLEESYFSKAVKFINERRDEFTSYKLNLFKSINEASSSVVVLESFSDFFVKIKEIIDKFLKFIKSIFKRFITQLNKMIGSEKYLEKNKKELYNFKASDIFNFDGFNYTFYENIPAHDAIIDFNNDLFNDLYGDINHSLDIESIKNTIDNMDIEDECCKFRAKIIGKDGYKIDINEYPEELFKIYRDNETTSSDIEVNSAYVKMVSERFFKYKKVENDINKQYKKIEDAYKSVQDRVSDIVKRNGDLNAAAFISRLPDGTGITKIDGKDLTTSGFNMSSNFMFQLDIYIKQKCSMITEFSNIHTLALSAKLDAIKECFRQDKNILYMALYKIQRTDSKRKE